MNTLNLSLTAELRQFIDENCGDNTLFSTPSEFVRQILREKKERIEAAKLRESILAGLEDIAAGRYVEFTGDIMQDLETAKKQTWWNGE